MPSFDRLIESLQAFQKRKGMWVHPVDVASVENFLAGFEAACGACGIEIDREVWWKVQEARGWKRRAVGPVPQMEGKGLGVEEMMDELIEIEIAMFSRMAELST